MPRAAARSRRSRKVLLMIDRVVGKIRAAKAPITKRAATSALRRRDQRAGGAGGGEAEQAGDQGGTPAEPVREAAGREHQPGEGEVVAVDDPLQLAGAGRELREIDGRATLTIVVSRLMASTAAHTVARTQPLCAVW